MEIKEANKVGRFAIQLEVANHEDVMTAARGWLEADKVCRGVVDSGATRLVLSEKVVRQLGLPIRGKGKIHYVNNASVTGDAAHEAQVTLLSREGIFTAIVEPKRRTAFIGAIVLEDLDFVVDCTQQRLVPRDPHFVVSEIE